MIDQFEMRAVALNAAGQFLDAVLDGVFGPDRQNHTEEQAVEFLKANVLVSSGREASEDMLLGISWALGYAQHVLNSAYEQLQAPTSDADATGTSTEEVQTNPFADDETPTLTIVE